MPYGPPLSGRLILWFRACAGVQEELKEEVLRMAKQVNVAGFNLLCIDTENQFVTTGFGKEIAQVPPLPCVPLPVAAVGPNARSRVFAPPTSHLSR